jgi:citrate lyase synthetase
VSHPRYSGEEVQKRAEELYQQKIRTHVEEGNEGKILVIDIETGEYEIDDSEMTAVRRALAKHPEAALWTMRIGFNAVHSLGGSLRPIKR